MSRIYIDSKIALVKQADQLRDQELRRHARRACISIGQRSRCAGANPGRISYLERQIYLRCTSLILRYTDIDKILKVVFIDEDEHEQVKNLIGRILKRSLKHTFCDGGIQDNLAERIGRFEKTSGIVIDKLPE